MSKMVYQWTPGSHLPVDPQAAGERLEALRTQHGGHLTPEIVVKDAKAVRSPLHDCFTWDDAEAARLRREEEARYLIRSIRVTFLDTDRPMPSEPVRAFVHIKPERECDNGYYLSIQEALEDDEVRSQLLSRALSEIQSWRKRYEQINQLARIFKAIDKVQEELVL